MYIINIELIEIVAIRSSNEISLTKTHISSIIDPHNDQLPVGLIAQLVDQRARVDRGQGSRRSGLNFQAILSLLLKWHNVLRRS